jgi:transcriptional regulator with XRE-family HTH domain
VSKCAEIRTGKKKDGIICPEVVAVDYVQLGIRVRIRRTVLELTQEGLAEKIGVSTSFIGHIERGSRKLSVDTLYALCKALDTSADFLMGI